MHSKKKAYTVEGKVCSEENWGEGRL